MLSSIHLSRRHFVHGLTAVTALLGLGSGATALAIERTSTALRQGPKTLRGTHFELSYRPLAVNYTGNKRYATAINGSVPAPILRWKQGETVTLSIRNHLAEDASIHWHGLILPSGQDGVPGISQGYDGIKPGHSFQHRFPVTQSGTYWYHSHSAFHEQTGAYGVIIIEPKDGYPFSFDREYVVQLSDWSDENPSDIYAKLKKMSHYYNTRERTLVDLWQDIRETGLQQTMSDRSMWSQMRMSDRDISDVTGATYTFLMNGIAPADGWLGLFKRGEKVLLRFVNSAAMTFFDICIPGLKMTVVAADGQYIQPVSVDEFRIGVAETYDVMVEPKADRAYCLFAQAMDRSGYARGTLTPDVKLTAEVPKMDAAPILTHADMGMAHGHHTEHVDHSNMKNMDHSQHKMKSSMGSGKAGFGSNQPVIHTATEYGPHIDMRAENPQYRLNDPGLGLRNNGRTVLTYVDLRNLYKTPDPREPEREINLHLTGNMSRYMWSFDGIRFADAEPVHFNYGERLRINLINDTMMVHPIHLHGMWSDLETGDADYIPRKHTVVVQPGAKISYLVTADAMGAWAYHCHLIYHMPGMFRKVVVS